MKVILLSFFASLAVLVIFVPSLFEKSVIAQKTTKAIGASIPYYLFPTEIEEIEEEILKLPHDAYSVQTIVANKGENLLLNSITLKARKDIRSL